MAEQPTAPDQNDVSSYSDPLYDRLERVVNALGRQWLLILVAIVLAVGIALTLRSVGSNTPEAASVLTLNEARADLTRAAVGDDAAALATAEAGLQAVVSNADVLPLYQVAAGIYFVDHLLEAGRPSEALPIAEAALKQAGSLDDPRTRITAELAVAAAHEDLADYAAAISAYTAASNRAGSFPHEGLIAALGLGRCQIAKAEAIADSDAELASDLRLSALAALEPFTTQEADFSRAGVARGQLHEMARHMVLDLYRRFPELRPEALDALEEESEPVIPEADEAEVLDIDESAAETSGE